MSLKISIFQEFILYEEQSFILFIPLLPVIYLFIYLFISIWSWMPKTTLGRSHDSRFSEVVLLPEFCLAKDLGGR